MLVFARSRRGTSQKIIREPEARQILAWVLDARGIPLALEAPTKEKYSFSTNHPDTANVDLVADPEAASVSVEFKTGQPDRKMIEKDFQKMIAERFSGCAFYHILENTDRQTVSVLLNKYGDAYLEAMRKMSERGLIRQKWFLHHIVVRAKREVYWRLWPDVTRVVTKEFNADGYTRSLLT
jgi:hypothetical protein